MQRREVRQARRRAAQRRWLAALTAVALGLSGALVATTPAAAAADGDVEVIKTASVTTVQPGDTFTYTITLTCTSLLAGCTNASLVDQVPDEFIVDDVSISAGLQGTIAQDGQSVEVDFTAPLADGTVGIPAGSTGAVTIQVHADEDLPYSANGIPVPNTATTDADTQTSGPLSDTVEVTPVIPLVLDPEVDKTMSPPSALANPGEPVVADVTVTNSSNAAVEQLVISDPADPAAVPSPFDQLDFTGVGTVSYPQGADTAQIVYITDGGPVEGTPATAPDQPVPPAVPATDVIGVQIVFTDTDGSGIPVDAAGGVEIGFAHPADVGDLAGNLTVTNIAEGEVSRDGESQTDTGSATHQIVAADIDLIADKSFDPSEVAAGDTSTATITAGNASDFDLAELTVTEPALTDPGDPWAGGFDTSMAFAGFTAGIAYPDGATGATITYYYDDGSSDGPLAFDDGEEPPAPSGDVVRWEITFTGDIPNGASTDIPFDVQTDPDQAGYPATLTNVADVSGTDPNGGTSTEQVDADLLVYEAHIEVITGKSIYPDAVLDRPGEWVLVTLDAQIAEFPRSTTDATTIVVQDPAVVPAPIDGTFWDFFNATEITETAVPDGATLTITYWNGSAWVPLLDEDDQPVVVEGPTVFSMDIPADEQDLIQGLQFTFTADDGQPFPPGTTVEPHFTAEVRETERDTTTVVTPPALLANCALGEAEGAGGLQSTPTDDDTACAETNIDPYDPDGDGPDVLDKQIDPNVVTARSQATAEITLHWSTGGLSGVEQVVIQDEAAPPPAPPALGVADSFWDAFDITGVAAITDAMDPHLEFDQITAVQLWDGDSWEDLENDPCPAACDGTFPGVTLTDADRQRALGIRLLVAESPTRAQTAEGDLTAPPVGSGVARSSGNDRDVVIDIALRDYLRSDASQPVIGSLDYNIDDADPAIGTVLDVASVTGTDSAGQEVIGTEDSDTIAILDVPLNVDLTKTWSNSPFGIPPDGTPQDAYPTGRVQLTATNRTAAKVDTMMIADPGPTADENPFTWFDLYDIRQISVPPGTESTVVTLSLDSDQDGVVDDTQDVDVSTALGMTSGELVDVVGILVTHDGRIDAGAVAVVEMDLRLREDVRGQPGTRVSVTDSPVDNRAQATVDDAGGGAAGNIPAADADASVTLAELEIGVEAGKSFAPDVQVEPDDDPVVMTLTGQPTIETSARVGGMAISDTAPTFWNAFDFVGIDPSFTLATPINQVKMVVRTGGSFVDIGSGVVHVGGAWTAGEWVDAADLAAFIADPLPDGANAADVNAIRFEFQSVDGTGTPVQWENPVNPLQEVPVLVQRRAELHTGGPVPSDLAGNEAAPGEAAAGEFTNETNATACAILAPVCAIGQIGTVTDQATDVIYYQHATTAVEIDKQPTGVYAPGQSIPYEITVTNTGDWPIVNPVITDDPTASGTLIVNPDATDPFAYDLEGAAPEPPTGLALPEDAASVTASVDEATGAITFTFPTGSVLEVGQSYTISIDMVFAPGVPGGIPVDNVATITGDRQFDSCNGGGVPVDECADTATVTPLIAGAVRSGKFVRAEDTELGAFDYRDGSAEGCEAPNTGELVDPDGEGFYWFPCVPRSKPGDTVHWRFGVQNTGNVDLDRLVMVDLLPTPGDTGAISDLPRESAWSPILEASELVPVRLPDGAVITFTVTTDPGVCADDLSAPGAPGDPLEACGAGYWVAPGSVDQALITGVRTVIDMPDNPLAPGESILIDAPTITPPVSETAGDDTIAWNSVAVGAHTTEEQTTAGGGQVMVPSEGTKVGAALATGGISVRKELSGDGIGYAPDSFTVDVVCTSVGVEIDPAASVVVTPGTPEVVTGLPWGSECTLSESDQGQADFTVDPDTVIAVEPEQGLATITIDNEYLLAGLEVTKTVESAALDADGEPIDYGPFEVGVTCTYLGAAVFADGYDANDPMEFTIVDGDVVTLDGLPASAECTVSETDTNGAASTTVASATADVTTPAADGTSATIVLTPDADDAITNEVAFVNAYDVGSLTVEKLLDPVDSPFAEGPYAVHVTCVLGELTTWDGDLTLDVDAPVMIDDIATGSVCTVTETDDGFASETVIDPAEVTIGADAAVTVQVTNIYDEGSVTVTKVFEGDTRWAADSFEVTIICVDLTSGTLIVDIPGGRTRTLTAGSDPAWTASFERLPAGAACAMFESETGGSTSSEIVDENGERAGIFLVEADAQPQFSVVNTFAVGSIAVTKSTSGDGADPYGIGTFTVHLDCTYQGEPIAIPDGADRTLEITAAGETDVVVYEALPPGAECTITEPDDGGASDVVIDPETVTVTVTDADDDGTPEPAEVSIDNVFDLGAITVEKEISPGLGARWAIGEFEITMTCVWQGEQIEIDEPVRTLSVDGGLSTTYEGLPDGALCSVEETDTANAEVSISPTDPVTVDPDATEPVTITVTNTFATGAIDVVKEFDGAGAEIGADTTFEVELSCSWEVNGEVVDLDPALFVGGATRELDADNDYSASYLGLPVGAECTLTETYDGGAGTVTITPNAGDPAVGTATVGEGDPAVITVLNFFDSGPLELAKVVDGAGAEYFGQGPFTLHVTCTLADGELVPRVVYNADVEIGAGETVTIEGIPTGAVCRVTEPDDSVADSHEISGSPATIGSSDDEAPVVVTATNTFLIGSVRVDKLVVGGGADQFGAGPFEVTVECIDPASGIALVDIPGGAVRELNAANGYETTYEILPAGALCGIAETDDGGADSKRLLDENGDEIGLVAPGGGTRVGFFVIHPGVEQSFVLENTFLPPLPATGSDTVPVVVAGGVAATLILGGAVLMLLTRRRRPV
ncbi:DUF5979 domain-containing protein [Microbacterium sp. 2FI]|uniref:DUF5979 domain-containing protein n=1 Tax=Microbacterium sp. 2FI TaxID=2502193 RepID=UPI0010F8FE65|nr:DUF5979 domain-containing protein [Microbacterium sp. 2FI]